MTESESANHNWEALNRLQQEVIQWQNKNFPNCQDWELALGVCEEAGELAQCVLKMHRSMRVAEFDETRLRDAVGDILIFLLGFCENRGWLLSDVLEETSRSVLTRDWTKQQGNKINEP